MNAYEEYDYLNRDKFRNAGNTDCWEYNCGGFALGTFEWLELFSMDEYCEYCQELQDETIEELIYYGKGLIREVKDIAELKDTEFLVLFRYCQDEYGELEDYHFMKRLHNGTWVEKRGSQEIRVYSKIDCDVFDDDWHCGNYCYNCPIVMLAVDEQLY